MKKIGQVLIDSERTRVQTTGRLTRLNNKHEIESYCALGALGCEVNILTKETPIVSNYATILLAYGLDSQLKKSVKSQHSLDDKSKNEYDDLDDLIVHYNDSLHWSFKKIGMKLLNLQKRGYFKRIRGVGIAK